jgi:hypothetical protein
MTHLTETQRIEILILIGCGDKTRYSRGQNKVGHVFSLLNLLFLDYENIYLFIIVTPVYSTQF